MGQAESAPLTPPSALEATVLASSAPPDDAEPTVLLCTIDEVFVYRLPPRPTAAGYRAAEWPGGLDNPYKTGFLRVTGRGPELFLCVWLRDAATPEATRAAAARALDVTAAPAARGHALLLQCCVPAGDARALSTFVEPVLDSSRYFVLRLERGGAGGATFVGIGFRERNAAFEFKETMSSYISQNERNARAKTAAAAEAEAAALAPVLTSASLPAHALGGAEAPPANGTTRSAQAALSPSAPALAPPRAPLLAPPPGSRAATTPAAVASDGFAAGDPAGAAAGAAAGAGPTSPAAPEDDDFGDFEGA